MKKLRKEYLLDYLNEEDLNINPYKQFADWFNQAQKSGLIEPNAFCLSTVSKNAKPSSRMLLLKEFSKNGFVFFTNYSSKKGSELKFNTNASMLFYWPGLERQVRIEGKAIRITAKSSDRYFKTRPLESRIGAIISRQSTIIESRETLDLKFSKIKKNQNDFKLDRPKEWGGYILKANYFEFWQGRENRLHDRMTYTLTNRAGWKIARLSP